MTIADKSEVKERLSSSQQRDALLNEGYQDGWDDAWRETSKSDVREALKTIADQKEVMDALRETVSLYETKCNLMEAMYNRLMRGE